jgi:superfamily II DNA or RNA helicase
MAAKPRPPSVRSVRTPEALQALDAWLATFDPAMRRRGGVYYEEGRVLGAWADADHYVEADVEGQEVYGVTLFLTRGKWTSRCECPMGADCKHAAAAGLAWIARKGADFETEEKIPLEVAEALDDDDVPSPIPFPRLPTFAPKPAKNKISFRERWAPVIAEKLGRPLTESEGRVLGQLAALFAEFQQSRNTLYDETLRRHGFTALIPPGAQSWTPLFPGWWTYDTAPADPWALWQYLAYSAELHGHPIPEGLRPLTDTSRVHAALEALLTRQQQNAWRTALSTPTELDEALPASPLRDGIASLRARLSSEGGMFIEARAAPEKPWKPPSQKWTSALLRALPADFESFAPAEAALALSLAMSNRYGYRGTLKHALPPDIAGAVLASRAAQPAIVLPDGRPFAIEPEPLSAEAIVSATLHGRLEVRLVAPDGSAAVGARLLVARPAPLYLHAGRVWRGPPPLPAVPLPVVALGDAGIMTGLRARGVRLPASFEAKIRHVRLRPLLKCWLEESGTEYSHGSGQFYAQLLARADDPPCAQEWRGVGGWQWAKGGTPPGRRPDEPILEFDRTAADAAGARFADFRLGWTDWHGAWSRPMTKNFPEEFLAWHATLPPGLEIDASPELAGFFDAPLRATVDFSALPADSGHDWFDLTIALRVEDTTLSADEIALLLKARGKWVRLPKGGWRRLDFATEGAGGDVVAALDRLGLTAEEVFASGKPATHRLHALQLAGEAAALEARDARLASALRERVAALTALPPPPLPAGLAATLRPYQQEGFHFLAHLSAQGFGGVLADDMGLGKTVQALAWLLHLRGTARDSAGKFRALVVCPKSVVHGWLAETARFVPGFTVAAFNPALASAQPGAPAKPGEEGSALDAQLLVTNYTQLRLHATWFQSEAWDAVVLDEGQFIKNPASQAAAAARALSAHHRIVLTGTPVENRLTDLWSLFAFAQPGLLGAQAAFRRQYDEREPAALGRLHRRVRHFLLRRTKAQAAPDLPPRTEDDLVVELEPAQRKLYDAELKRARAQLLGIETARALDQVRFNVLASLLRLRQICCHPALIDPAHADLPSAKLDALLERLEELHEEGHQVLVFSQFVEMLEIIRPRLAAAGIGHLMLTGRTENRAELVAEFQRDKTKTVFLLSLKAAGFGLNLTAASYAILYDPWWNPAVEAQAIDRTHRIGQTRPVIAYRLLADNTVEQKIRALQKEKAELAAAVVQEESLAQVLDLDSLRRILA